MKKSAPLTLGQGLKWVIRILAFLAMAASLIGVYQTHITGAGAHFGTTPASMALIAFALTTHLWIKTMTCDGQCSL